jgi:hypothetical protein
MPPRTVAPNSQSRTRTSRLKAARRREIQTDRRAIARLLTQRRGLLAPLSRRERSMVNSGHAVPNEPVRAATFAWLAREECRRLAARGDWPADPARPLVTLNELFAAAGLENSHARRVLGLTGEGRRRRDRLAGRPARIAATITAQNALALAAAMGIDPSDIDM